MTRTFVPAHGKPNASRPPAKQRPPSPADEALYRGAKVLLVFIVAGLVFGIGLQISLENSGVAWLLASRFASLGIAGGFAAAWSRWMAPAGTSALLSVTRRDAAATIGFVVALVALGAVDAEVLHPPRRPGASTLPPKLPIKVSGPTLDGGEFRSSDSLGRVLLVDFWGTSCEPCVKELPNLQALYDAYHKDGLDMVGIALDPDRRDLLPFLKKHPQPWPQIHIEGAGWQNPLAQRYDVDSIPRILVVDREGNLAADNLLGAELETAIRAALGPDVPNRRAIRTPTDTVSGKLLYGLYSVRRWLLLSFMQPPWIVTTVCAVCGAILFSSADMAFRQLIPKKRGK